MSQFKSPKPFLYLSPSGKMSLRCIEAPRKPRTFPYLPLTVILCCLIGGSMIAVAGNAVNQYQQPTLTYHAVGDAVTIAGWQICAEGFSWAASSTPRPGYQELIISIRMKNISASTEQAEDSAWYLRDAQGYAYMQHSTGVLPPVGFASPGEM